MMRLLDPETGMAVDVPVSPHIVAAFRKQVEMDMFVATTEQFNERMRRWREAIAYGLSYALTPPTEKQIVFAATIARMLGVDLPKEALQFRGATSDFIDAHMDECISRHRQGPTRAGQVNS